MATTWTDRLAESGVELPSVVPPVASYTPAVRTGNLVYTSGQLPIVDGELSARGKVHEGAEGVVRPDEATAAARVCALNALAAAAAAVGDLERLTGVVKLTGFVASVPEFTGQPGVINGASEVLGEIFGDDGRHARSAVGVPVLPKAEYQGSHGGEQGEDNQEIAGDECCSCLARGIITDDLAVHEWVDGLGEQGDEHQRRCGDQGEGFDRPTGLDVTIRIGQEIIQNGGHRCSPPDHVLR